MMKTLFAILFIFTATAGAAMADAGEPVSLEQADPQVRQHTRRMVEAGIDASAAEALTQKMIRQRYETREIIRAQKIVMEARKAGLPTDLIMLKAHEGMAKSVPAPRVLGAMETVRQRYAHAWKTADGVCTEKPSCRGIGEAVAEGMAAGFDQASVAQVANRLRRRHGKGDRADADGLAEEAFLTARDMVRRGVASKTTEDVVCSALAANYGIREMRQLRQRFNSQSSQSDPEALGRQFRHQFRGGEDTAEAPDGSGSKERHQNRNGKDAGNSSGGGNGNSGGSGGGGSSGGNDGGGKGNGRDNGGKDDSGGSGTDKGSSGSGKKGSGGK